jgi:hypothetical protein
VWPSESGGAMEAAVKAESLASEHMFGLTRRQVSNLLLEMVLPTAEELRTAAGVSILRRCKLNPSYWSTALQHVGKWVGLQPARCMY